jgi:hypothetical protein
MNSAYTGMVMATHYFNWLGDVHDSTRQDYALEQELQLESILCLVSVVELA